MNDKHQPKGAPGGKGGQFAPKDGSLSGTETDKKPKPYRKISLFSESTPEITVKPKKYHNFKNISHVLGTKVKPALRDFLLHFQGTVHDNEIAEALNEWQDLDRYDMIDGIILYEAFGYPFAKWDVDSRNHYIDQYLHQPIFCEHFKKEIEAAYNGRLVLNTDLELDKKGVDYILSRPNEPELYFDVKATSVTNHNKFFIELFKIKKSGKLSDKSLLHPGSMTTHYAFEKYDLAPEIMDKYGGIDKQKVYDISHAEDDDPSLYTTNHELTIVPAAEIKRYIFNRIGHAEYLRQLITTINEIHSDPSVKDKKYEIVAATGLPAYSVSDNGRRIDFPNTGLSLVLANGTYNVGMNPKIFKYIKESKFIKGGIQ